MLTNRLKNKRERELATLDEKLTRSGIAEPYARYKIKGENLGGEWTTPLTTAFPEAAKLKVKVQKIIY